MILTSKSEGRIAGHLRTPDGKPVAGADVLLIDADGSGFNTLTTNKEGYFSFDDQGPSQYIVAARRPGAPKLKIAGCGGASCEDELPTDLYYFGNTTLRSAALAIKLSVDEKRDDLEIVLPATEPNRKP